MRPRKEEGNLKGISNPGRFLIAVILCVGLFSACIRRDEEFSLEISPTSTPHDQAQRTPTEPSGEQETPTEPPEESGGIPIVPGKISNMGILAVIPQGSGSTNDPAAIKAVNDVGAGYMRVNLDWAVSEPSPGELSFDTRNDRKIERIEGSGLRIFPTVYVGIGWMSEESAASTDTRSRSYPPDDLSSSWDDVYGYSQGYYEFLYQFFTHYRGHFDYVAIENEANSSLFWGGTADEYVRLLRTAYKAIKDADPDVFIVDSGFVSSVWGICIFDDYLKMGLKSKDEIVDMAVSYYSSPTATHQIQSENELDEYLSNPRVQEQCRRVNHILGEILDSVDGINFHFYEDYRVMHFITDWLELKKSSVGSSPAIVTNELGQRGPDLSYAKSDEHAIEVFKKLITGLSLQLDVIVWFSIDTIGKQTPSPDKVGLFGAEGVLRPVARTFELVLRTIDSEYYVKEIVSAGPTLFHYVFADSVGNPSLEALWSEGDEQLVSLSSPEGAREVLLIDYAGSSQSFPVEGGSFEFLLDGVPYFILWK
ncbi:MAG: hypothetical protein GTO18_13105 [Anaerolineales bacterium]|nr:hypothetical protein [Anaerolineales bacterium]